MPVINQHNQARNETMKKKPHYHFQLLSAAMTMVATNIFIAVDRLNLQLTPHTSFSSYLKLSLMQVRTRVGWYIYPAHCVLLLAQNDEMWHSPPPRTRAPSLRKRIFFCSRTS